MDQSHDVRYRRQQQQQPQHDFHQPYRDDPNAPPVQLDSFPTPVGVRGQQPNYAVSSSVAIGMGNGGGDNDWKKQQRHSGGAAGSSIGMINIFRKCANCCCYPSTDMGNGGAGGNGGEGINGKYYRDDFNDFSWTCNVGTNDENGIWLNRSDPAGTIMCMMVWVLLGYSCLTITLLAQTSGIPPYQSFIYAILVVMALSCHIKTTLTDPGSVPASAVPTEAQRKNDRLSMCSQCQTFKPPLSHHCRICNRCISRMDHHCPWMNNCVGAGNMKHFFLFLIYTWSCSFYCLCLLGWNYFFCASEDCEFNIVLVQLVRIMTVLSVCAWLFTSSMLMNVVYGIMTGIGTIDRLKKKATDTMQDSLEEPIPLQDIFGIGPWYTWPIPVDPLFEDYDNVMGYSTPQRLLREQILREQLEAPPPTPTSLTGGLMPNSGGGGGVMIGSGSRFPGS
mmetsp:Transcript_61445/g.150388  ORF Transcript_61445/g.150388 Transcript_61445/m.150388 type:complete len:447 (+) Transcript_61445:177-1517(+)